MIVIGTSRALPLSVICTSPSARGPLSTCLRAYCCVRACAWSRAGPTHQHATAKTKARDKLTAHGAMRYNDVRRGETSMEINDKAPDFRTTDENGKEVALKDFRGKTIVLYFYPKADTPGCTKEACGFRDSYAAIKKTGVVLLG